jgi:hypothetical protein
LGEVIARDMIAVPVSGDLRLGVVGAPSYCRAEAQPGQSQSRSTDELASILV